LWAKARSHHLSSCSKKENSSLSQGLLSEEKRRVAQEQQRLRQTQREEQERASKWQRGMELGCQRAEGVFTTFRAYDVLMIISLVWTRPVIQNISHLVLGLWCSLMISFALDVYFATKLIKKLDARPDLDVNFISSTPVALINEIIEYCSELEFDAHINFICNAMTLSLWIVYHFFGSNDASFLIIAFVTAIRFMKLRPVSQFWDALITDDVGLALGEFAETSVWSKSSASTDRFSSPGVVPAPWHCTHVVLTFLLLGACGCAGLHMVRAQGFQSNVFLMQRPVEFAGGAVETCELQGGDCEFGSCWPYGILTGAFSGTLTIVLAAIHNAKPSYVKNGVTLTRHQVPGWALCVNGLSCTLGGIIGGGAKNCCTPGMQMAVEGSLMVPGLIVAVLAM